MFFLKRNNAQRPNAARKNASRFGNFDAAALPGRNFLWGAAGLAFSLFLALDSTAVIARGEFRAAAILAATALLLTGYIAVRSLPFLARQVTKGRPGLRLEYQITREGVSYLAVILVIAVAALNTGNNLLFLILAILLAAIVGSGILSRMVLSGVTLEMAWPPRLFAEQPAVCRLKLHNGKRRLPSYSLTVSAAEPHRASRKRQVGSSGNGKKILVDPVYFPYLPKGSTLEQDVAVSFSRRGRYTHDGFTLSSKFPFGFIRKKRRIETRQEVLVLPPIAPLETFQGIPPAVAGELESLRHDERGHDLYGLRDYRASDSARNIDWKATARAQCVKAREFSREDERRIRLILDHRLPSFSAVNLERFERAVRLCASFAWHFAALGAFLECAVGNQEIAAGFGEPTAFEILEALATVEAQLDSEAGSRSWLGQNGSGPAAWNIILASDPGNTSTDRNFNHSTLIPFEQI
jgi:uncharacterized protein (DUF58 family)